MAGTTGVFELSALALGSNAAANVLPIVDTNDTTQSAQGSLAKVTLAGLYRTETTPVVVSTPLPDVAQTWNAGGVTFTATRVNVTDTASAAGSKLADWQVGGVSKASIDKAGTVTGVALTATGAVTGATLVGTLTTAAQPNITSVGALTALTVAGLLTASAGITLTGTFTMATAVSKVVPGATSLSLRNHADSADNFILLDSGAATFRSSVTVGSTAQLLSSTGSQTDYAGASTGTLTNAPAAGNPTKWLAVVDNGTVRKFPTWQ